MMPRGVRPLLVSILAAVAAATFSACGEQGISVPDNDPTHAGAVLFSQRCAGCHTISAAGTQGSGGRTLRNQGPNFDQRFITYQDAIFAIRNGGFSGAIMPQNIVVGDQANQVARFLAKWSGSDVDKPPGP
jgi:mono/diheme cytochrome c family protein